MKKKKQKKQWSVCDVLQIMIWLRPTGYSDFQNRIGFETACENPNHNFWFWKWKIIFQELEKIRADGRLRCDMWVEKNSRLRSGYECCCCYCCVCALFNGSHAKAVNRRHVRGACCAVCLWRGHAPQSRERDHFFCWPLASAAKQYSSQSTRVSMLQ